MKCDRCGADNADVELCAKYGDKADVRHVHKWCLGRFLYSLARTEEEKDTSLTSYYFATDPATTEAVISAMMTKRGCSLSPWVEHNHHMYSRHYGGVCSGMPAALLQGCPGRPYLWWAWDSCNGYHRHGLGASLEAAKLAADTALTQTTDGCLSVCDVARGVEISDFDKMSADERADAVARIMRGVEEWSAKERAEATVT